MMKFFSKNRKVIASFLLLVIVLQLGYVPTALALTSGASQPEVQSFQPAGTSEMVDLFTGDFSYNIPLFELPGPNGGYPFNLSYQAGSGMDTEASWVGLGFNLNPGAINRQMRGLPDEFKGDLVYTKMSLEPSVTIGVGIGTGVELFGGALGLGMGLGVYRNNYRGIGYSIDGSVSFQKSTGGGMTGGIGLSVSADSKAGVNVQPSLSLGYKASNVGLTAGYNSRQGLTDISASYTYTHYRDIDASYEERKFRQEKSSGYSPTLAGTSGVNISLASPSYTPQMTMAMQNLNLSTTFKIGGGWWGVSYTGNVTGYYNEQRLRDKGKRLSAPAYGYLNYQHTEGDNVLMDFNREKDGAVSKESPNLAIPALTYDIYSVSGQGISAMYRPMRSDIGVVRDQKVESGSVGGSFGVDVGIPAHVGTNLMVNHSRSTSGAWTDNNKVYGHERFAKQEIDNDYEPWHFQVHGERVPQPVAALDPIYGENAVRVKLDGTNLIGTEAVNFLEGRDGDKPLPEASSFNRDRQSRSNVIQTITIGELLRDTTVLLPLFKVRYDSAGIMKKLRHELPKKPHHVAGFTALTPEGLRYTYGIPVYNTYQEEVVFSARKASLGTSTSRVDVVQPTQGDPGPNDRDKDPYFAQKDSDKFLKRVEMPPYAHSYLLTSIVGADYVDVTNNGVTPDDLGYWVKFTYRKTASADAPYKWRDPYSSAHLQEGWKTDPRDDRGSFTYGEKEMWYLERAETKSHIADFTITPRGDGKGVFKKLQNDNPNFADLQGAKSYKLDAVTLYARTSNAAHAIKTVKFDYDYSLCKNVYNGTTGGGKLTLKKLYFEYGGTTGSARGSLNPYVFDYHENIHAENPDYDQHAYDRWGNYKPYPEGDYTHNVNFPYAEQDSTKKAEIDRNAAVWSLREIRLPSGGKIVIDYESDDYAYVQHKQAMQMTPIVTPQGSAAPAEFALQDDGQVYFKLQRPLPGSLGLTPDKQRAEVKKYLDLDRGQLYFKIKMNLRSASEDLYEYISGYADIDTAANAKMELHTDGSGNYAYGSFFLKKEEEGTHPFSLRGWQHLRTNQPELSNSSTPLAPTEDNDDRVRQMKTLGNAFTQIDQMFKGFYQWCREHNWSREIRISESWVRLNCIDKVKYGGGLRVKQLAMLDNWKDDTDGVYGQVYDYTTVEGGGTISSGVAAYEPLIGGEENALRYAKRYVESVPLRSDNNMFFEYPINESYYPGPQVGYSRVTARSLAAASLEGATILVNGQRVLPEKGDNVAYGTTGVSVSEFYTAREFPVFTDELDKVNKPFKLAVTIPLLGTIGVSLLSTSQGYSITTNDMHGKPRMTSTYKQSPQGVREEKPSSWVRYNYQQEDRVYDGETVKDISAYFEDKGDGTLSLADSLTVVNNHAALYSMGQESELFLDMREFEDNTWSGGGALNMDLIYIIFGVIPVFTIWPSISKSQARLRTSVANKVMFKSGTLLSMEAFDGGSTVRTEYKRWDKVTGACVLTTVTNNFNAPIYNYTINAHTQYQGMGPAYQNAGLTFSVTDVDPAKPADAASTLYLFRTAMSPTQFVPGDEFLLYPKEGGFVQPVSFAVYVGVEDGQMLLYSRDKLADAGYDARIVRSGYRNHLNVAAGTITALQNPLVPGSSTINYSRTIRVPAH